MQLRPHPEEAGKAGRLEGWEKIAMLRDALLRNAPQHEDEKELRNEK
jgi:hypothetical protein